MRSPVGHYGFTTPDVIGPTPIPYGTATSRATAVMGSDGHNYPPEYWPNDGFHTTTGGPQHVTVQPVALSQHETSPVIQFATFDGIFVVAGAVSAAVAIRRFL